MMTTPEAERLRAKLDRAQIVVGPLHKAIGNDDIASHVNESVAWPEPLSAEGYCGLAGQIVKAIEPETESDPAAILLQTLTAFGALVGRGPHYRVEGDEHHSNLFALLVGDTAKGRKGTSWGRVRGLFAKVHGWPNVVNGLSSGEGLKWQVRDPVEKKDGSDPGAADKRLLVVEQEFAQVLKQAARPGNTLSPTLRCAWDGTRLSSLTKNDPVTATGAHICVIGHITADELRADLTATDRANGFGNRLLLMCVKRSKTLPHGGHPLAPGVEADLASRIRKAVDHAQELQAIQMTSRARYSWEQVYSSLSEGCPGLLGAMTNRAEAQCIRLSLLYALMDRAVAIDEPHLAAAIAVWERCFASAQHIFGSALGDVAADKILRALKAAGPDGLRRTEISRRVFSGNKTADRIGAALELLERRGIAMRRQEKTDGAAAEVWTSR